MFTAVTLPLFLLMIDFYGIVVALPAIGADLGGSTGELGWVVNAFAVGSVGTRAGPGPAGRPVGPQEDRGRRRGRLRRLLAGGGTGADPAAADPGPGAGRGVRLDVLSAASLAIVSNAFGAARRSTAIGLWGGVGGIGSAIGPLLAGVVVDQASWRWFFAMNVPFLLVAAVLVVRDVPESRDDSVTGVDWRGFGLVTAALVLVVVGLQQAVSDGLTAPLVLITTSAGLVLLVVFALVEQRTAEPLVELALFKRRAYAAPASLAFLANWAFGVVMFFLTLYLQEIVGDDAATTGAVFVTTLPFALVGGISGLAARRLGARPVLAAAMGLLAAGAATFVGIDSTDAITLVIIGLVVTGIGQGLVFNQSTAAAMASIEESKAGVASGMVNTVRMVGYSVGVALTSVLVTSVEGDQVATAAADHGLHLTAGQIDAAREALSGSQAARSALGDLGPTVRTAADDVVQKAFLSGFRAGMVLTVVVCLVGVAVALAVPGRRRSAPDEDQHDHEQGQPGGDGAPGDAGRPAGARGEMSRQHGLVAHDVGGADQHAVGQPPLGRLEVAAEVGVEHGAVLGEGDLAGAVGPATGLGPQLVQLAPGGQAGRAQQRLDDGGVHQHVVVAADVLHRLEQPHADQLDGVLVAVVEDPLGRGGHRRHVVGAGGGQLADQVVGQRGGAHVAVGDVGLLEAGHVAGEAVVGEERRAGGDEQVERLLFADVAVPHGPRRLGEAGAHGCWLDTETTSPVM